MANEARMRFAQLMQQMQQQQEEQRMRDQLSMNRGPGDMNSAKSMMGVVRRANGGPIPSLQELSNPNFQLSGTLQSTGSPFSGLPAVIPSYDNQKYAFGGMDKGTFDWTPQYVENGQQMQLGRGDPVVVKNPSVYYPGMPFPTPTPPQTPRWEDTFKPELPLPVMPKPPQELPPIPLPGGPIMPNPGMPEIRIPTTPNPGMPEIRIPTMMPNPGMPEIRIPTPVPNPTPTPTPIPTPTPTPTPTPVKPPEQTPPVRPPEQTPPVKPPEQTPPVKQPAQTPAPKPYVPPKPPEDPVAKLYKTVLGREPDAEGLAYWKKDLASGQTLKQVEANMRANPEATIVKLYRQILGRVPDDAGRAYWLDEMKRGVTSADDLERILREAKKSQKK